MGRIVVVGSAASDQMVKLTAPLREGRHLRGTDQGARLGGGAANSALALARAGHVAMLLGAVGDDDLGGRLRDELVALGVDVSHLVSVAGPSTRSLVLVDGQGERTIVNLARAREGEPPRRLATVAADCIYVRDRAPDLSELLEQRARTGLVVAHMPPVARGARPATVLIVSASDVGPEILDHPFAAGQEVAGPPLRWVVVTRGPGGAWAFDASGGPGLHAPARVVTPVDTTGAGDAFAAGLVHGLVSGRPMAEALAIAVAWGTEATLWDSSSLPLDAVLRLLRDEGRGTFLPTGVANGRVPAHIGNLSEPLLP